MVSARRLRALFRRSLAELRLEFVRWRVMQARAGDVVRLGPFVVRITDGPNAYMQYKDEVVRRCYAFVSSSPAPVVIDGGANMGLFSLVTKRDHPGARITAFEPDPEIAALLRENLDRNGAGDVTIINAALGARSGEATFAADGQAGGALSAAGTTRVRVERLSDWLMGEVDFLKLNIEGAELEVLREAADAGRLRHVRAMVVEYHGWPDGEQRLGAILQLLEREGFRYLLHDFDEQTNPATKPPFRPPAGQAWFALLYAWREATVQRAERRP
jgi:FkbM family methyltransferase